LKGKTQKIFSVAVIANVSQVILRWFSLKWRGFSRHQEAAQRTGSDVAVHVKLPPRMFRRQYVKAPILYRISSVLLLLFAAAHTLEFRQTDPEWGVESLIGSMRSVRFDVQGFSRTYWDFYIGFGLFVSVFLVFAAVLAWQLGGLAPETLARMRGPAWALVICFAAVTILSWRYFFIAPVVSAIVITVCLTAAAWLSAKTG
jgi:hypothetical protein